MNNLKAIKLFYMLYSLYTVFMLLVSDYNFSYAIAGLSCIWLCYFAYKHGVLSKKTTLEIKNETETTNKTITKYPLSNIGHWNNAKYIVAAFISIASSIIATNYYTGKNFTQVISTLNGNSTSAYYSYQKYFIESNIGSFSVSKIPFIIMLSVTTVLMIWSYLGIILENKRLSLVQLLFILITTSSYLYFGLARGTNFESFIVFTTLAYCILCKMQKAPKKHRKRYVVTISILAIIIVLIFRAVVSSRGVEFGNNITKDIHYNADGIIPQLFPMTTNIATSLFGYMGFGIYAIGVSILEILFYSPSNLILSLIPFGYDLLSEQSLTYQLSTKIEVGVRWFPDCINAIGLFGIPLFLILINLAGKAVKKIINGNYPALLKNIFNYLVFIEMISIPVGNFLLASSSNMIMLLFTIIWILSYRNNKNIKIGLVDD